jgi:hypothetical protein
MTGKPEVIGSSVGLVPTNALLLTEPLLVTSRLLFTYQANFLETRFWTGVPFGFRGLATTRKKCSTPHLHGWLENLSRISPVRTP